MRDMDLLSEQFVGKARPLLEWMGDGKVTDILINGSHSLYVEKGGRLDSVLTPFSDSTSLFDFIERLLVPLGKRIDATQPYIDGKLADGSRFHIILPPVAPEGPLISIRKMREPFSCSLEHFAPAGILEWLRGQVLEGRNILICGGTGSGKTTLLCRLLELIPTHERVVVIEESREIRLNHPHVVYLEARQASPDGHGGVTLRTLVRNALRMRPDRLVLGECRGSEAFDLLQVMNSGHRGSLCTLHANSAVDGLKRLESLVLMAGFQVPITVVREWISSSIQVSVFLGREGDYRQLHEIISISGMEGPVYRIRPEWRHLKEKGLSSWNSKDSP